ncbi:MAG TPA: serine/threonine-protein kinase [Sandaracinaceae bacterium LLY-WYZ-13_1]|nr:serine/threonine-protein kinase [Sandaracinaceae bacterium LLY-WYZ-13_1]
MKATPRAIGRYEVVDRMHSGTAAELFRVREVGDPTGTLYCLKRIPPSVGGSVGFALRFDEEMGLWETKLEHRNIVSVRDYGEDEGHYYVMEYVDGVDLGGALREGPLEPALVTYLGIELCRAFVFMHHGDPSRGRHKPVIHSDVTPDNILLGRDGAVKLSDFGLAKALGRTGADTITRARGKVRWMAPEQFGGDDDGDVTLNARTDLFALGLVLWFALIGSHPYAEGRARQRPRPALDAWIRERTLANERRSVAEAAPRAPAVLQGVIEGLLQPMERRTAVAEEPLERLLSIEELDAHDRLAARVQRCAASGAPA